MFKNVSLGLIYAFNVLSFTLIMFKNIFFNSEKFVKLNCD